MSLPRRIRGVVFDMDGTLVLPQTYMFGEMREALGITKKVDILDHVHSLPSAEQEEAQEKLRAIERRAMLKMQPQPGLREVMSFLENRKVPTTILTRNFPVPVKYMIDTFLDGYALEPIITREFKPPKPAPDGLLKIAESWNIDPTELVMVGDSIDDIEAGARAGAATVLLRDDHNGHLADYEYTTAVINSLPELIPLIEPQIILE